jgi:hypothetical protein
VHNLAVFNGITDKYKEKNSNASDQFYVLNTGAMSL